MFDALKTDLDRRMMGAYDAMLKEFGGLRTGRASPHFLDPIMVDAYGSLTPLNQVGNINVPEPRLLTVQVWDQNLLKAVEKAIRESQLGVNPAADGNLIRIPMPELTQERRQELVKLAKKYAENAKVGVRTVRRDGMDQLKQFEKDKTFSEDEVHRFSSDIQDLTDSYIKKIDQTLQTKEKDICQL